MFPIPLKNVHLENIVKAKNGCFQCGMRRGEGRDWEGMMFDRKVKLAFCSSKTPL
jgi:hypothetical protein